MVPVERDASVAFHRHTQIAMPRCIAHTFRSTKGVECLKQKTKLKAKGKRFYQNTHGKIYRVKPKSKLGQRKLLNKLRRQIAAAQVSA